MQSSLKFSNISQPTVRCTRAVWKVRGLTFLLRVETLWRCDDGLVFEVPPLASDALLTTPHPLLENVLQTVDHFEISCLGTPFPWLEKPRNRMGRVRYGLYGGCSNGISPIHFFQAEHGIQLISRPMWFLVFCNHGKGALRQEISKCINGLQHVFEKWVERFKKCITCQRRYFEKETVTAPPQSSDSE
jgi:hypothetical protein